MTSPGGKVLPVFIQNGSKQGKQRLDANQPCLINFVMPETNIRLEAKDETPNPPPSWSATGLRLSHGQAVQ